MAETPFNTAKFTVTGMPEDTFEVVRYSGREAISELFEFRVTLAAGAHVNPAALIRKEAVLTITGPKGALSYQGIVFSLRDSDAGAGSVFYEAMLTPPLRMLALASHNQIFLDKTLPDILELVLKDNGISSFDVRLAESYQPISYVCQFNETYFDFISRWMEHWGMSYFFNHGDGKLVVTDSPMAFSKMPHADLRYSPPSGLDNVVRDDLVKSFVAEYSALPKEVLLKDYNYETPALELQAIATVSESGQGVHYSYGNNFSNQTQAKQIARIRAEELACREMVGQGVALAPVLRSGYLMSLSGHPVSDMNGEYLVTAVEHEGRQRLAMTEGLAASSDDDEASSDYKCRFWVIPSKAKFRPRRETPKPDCRGHLTAKVDAEGSGQYGFLDEQGRYKVRLPFDLAGAPDGNASYWIRLATPYGGETHGMHFPLLKGTEVILSFVDGDIDRPVITSPMLNAQMPSAVTDKNAPLNAIKTAGGNQFVMGDQQGSQFIAMTSPQGASTVLLGANKVSSSKEEEPTSDDSEEEKPEGSETKKSNWGGGLTFATQGEMNEYVLGQKSEWTAGTKFEALLGTKSEVSVGPEASIGHSTKAEYRGDFALAVNKGKSHEMTHEGIKIHGEHEMMGTDHITLSAGASVAIEELNKTAQKTALGCAVALTTLCGGLKGIADGIAQGAANVTMKPDSGAQLGESIGSGLVSAAAAAAVQVLIYKKLGKVVEAIEQMGKQQTVARINLGKTGISSIVNTVVPGGIAASNLIKTEAAAIHSAINVQSSRIDMTNGSSAAVASGEGPRLTLEDGNKITASMGKTNSVTISETDIVTAVDKNQQTINSYSILNQVGEIDEGSFVRLQTAGIRSQVGADSSINITDAAIEIESEALTFNGAGDVSLNGVLIKIG